VEDPPPSDPAAVDSEARALAALYDFHREVDGAAARLALKHRARLQCRRGCAACCVDDLSVFEIEAERIRRAQPDLLRDGVPHAAGACAFLGENAECRIYEDRPYVCRTQGLPLRWFDDSNGESSGAVVERRDICPLNDTGVPLVELPDADCWLLGPAEARLAELAAGESEEPDPGGARPGVRVALRSLFRRLR
jgi:Fe-S-cluster containining protein